MLLEKLQGYEKQATSIYRLAAKKGLDVIKLLWARKGYSISSIQGFEIGIESGGSIQSQFGRVEEVGGSVSMRFGEISFYPDVDGFKWGYIIDTPTNRKKLATSLCKGWFTIQNQNIKKDVESIAIKLGLPTTYNAPRSQFVKKTDSEVKLEAENQDQSKTILALQKELALSRERELKREEEMALLKLASKQDVVISEEPGFGNEKSPSELVEDSILSLEKEVATSKTGKSKK